MEGNRSSTAEHRQTPSSIRNLQRSLLKSFYHSLTQEVLADEKYVQRPSVPGIG